MLACFNRPALEHRQTNKDLVPSVQKASFMDKEADGTTKRQDLTLLVFNVQATLNGGQAHVKTEQHF